MIQVDYRERPSSEDQQTLKNYIKRIGVDAETSSLPYGDAQFEGRGPDGSIYIGVERKKLHDMLNCIDDARYNAQRMGMKQMYQVSFLLIEGHWKPHDPQGLLMEGFHGGTAWAPFRGRAGRTLYSKLYRYLLSVSLSGVHVIYSRDLWHSAFNICEVFHYFQKPFHQHTSLLEMQKFAIPTLNSRPSLVRRWAADLTNVGLKTSELAERHFRKPITLANADETEWLKIPGVGIKTAQDIVKEIWGRR